MKTVHKFPVPFDPKSPKAQGPVTIRLPKGAQVLTMQADSFDNLRVWALVDPTAETVDRKFLLLATGEPNEDDGYFEYVATAQLQSGGLVFHLFALTSWANPPSKMYPSMFKNTRTIL